MHFPLFWIKLITTYVERLIEICFWNIRNLDSDISTRRKGHKLFSSVSKVNLKVECTVNIKLLGQEYVPVYKKLMRLRWKGFLLFKILLLKLNFVDLDATSNTNVDNVEHDI